MASDIFEAAQQGDVEAVRNYLRTGVDIEAKNAYGFTALHCAGWALNKPDWGPGLEVLRILLAHGASPNAMSKDGRSVLYLVAERSFTLEAVQLLIASGADPNVTDAHGNHIVINAGASKIKTYLSELTGHPVPPPPLKLKEAKLSAAQWREIKPRLDTVFDELNQSHIVAMQDAGFTQEDGFSDCAQEFLDRGGEGAGLMGVCFYTRQDLKRAKRTSLLSVGFWGAPDGDEKSTVRVGHRVVEIFKTHAFVVDWSGVAKARPTVCLLGNLCKTSIF